MSKSTRGLDSSLEEKESQESWGWLQDPSEGLVYSVMKREECSRRDALRKLQVDIQEKVPLRELPNGKAFWFNCTVWRRIENGDSRPWVKDERPITAWRIGDDRGALSEEKRGPIPIPLARKVIPVEETDYEYLQDYQLEDLEVERPNRG
jgi:hypothetical protein